MFKKNLLILSVCASLFIGCGGGGGGSSMPTVQKYDLYNYMFNSAVLDNNKVILTKEIMYDSDTNFRSDIDYFIDIKDDNSTNKFYSYSLYNENLDITQDNYKNILSNSNNISQSNLNEVISEQIKSTDLDDNTEIIYKRNFSIGDSFSVPDIKGGTITCNLNNHYEQINAKDKINSFFNTSYVSSDYIFNDVLEFICTNPIYPTLEARMYFQKNFGAVFTEYKEIVNNIEEREYHIAISQSIFSK